MGSTFVKEHLTIINKDNMKKILVFIVLLSGKSAFSQIVFPSFLQGTWKVENKEIYEHWDKLNEQTLKGFSYQISNGQITVSEYLEIIQRKREIVYTATVIGQNQGISVEFKQTNGDSILIFENPNHDFPKKISYKKISDTELFVNVSDGGQKGFSYRLNKQIPEKQGINTSSNPNYDRALAEKLGADDYGMKSYIFVILKTGNNPTTTDNNEISELFRGHLDNITRLVKEEKLIIAGPMGKNEKNYRGIFVLSNVETTEDAHLLLQTDPAIKAGLLDAELYDWYGSAALPEYLPISDKIRKLKP